MHDGRCYLQWPSVHFLRRLRLLHGGAGPQRTANGAATEARRRAARFGSAWRRHCREGRAAEDDAVADLGTLSRCFA